MDMLVSIVLISAHEKVEGTVAVIKDASEIPIP